ncbi:MAG: hypothetical protein ABI685_07805 [Ferruginibacter sp.]
MFTIQDFTAKYETYSDEELYIINRDVHNYSEEAGKALQVVIEKKGGMEALIKRLEAKAIIENEKIRIANEAAKLGEGGVDASFIKNTTTSSILSKEELNDIIETNVAKAEATVKDKKVDGDTIVKSLLGCGLATLTGGILASLQFVYFGATSNLMVIGTGLVCYATVKLVTKKSYYNTAVLLSSFAAFIFSYLLGMAALAIFGYLG